MRKPIIAILGIFLLTGCVKDTAKNHPPTIVVVPSATVGKAPMNVTLRIQVFDFDGDNVTLRKISHRNGIEYENHSIGIVIGNHEEPTNGTRQFETAFPLAGDYWIRLEATDGQETAQATLTIHAGGLPPYGDVLFAATAPVNQSCTNCSGGRIGPTAALGADGCRGFLTAGNGTDCLWYPLHADWVGQEFYANATLDADVDVEMRSDCSPAGTSIEKYITEGSEDWKVPEGAGCAVLWTYYSAPATIEFRIHEA